MVFVKNYLATLNRITNGIKRIFKHLEEVTTAPRIIYEIYMVCTPFKVIHKVDSAMVPGLTCCFRNLYHAVGTR